MQSKLPLHYCPTVLYRVELARVGWQVKDVEWLIVPPQRTHMVCTVIINNQPHLRSDVLLVKHRLQVNQELLPTLGVSLVIDAYYRCFGERRHCSDECDALQSLIAQFVLDWLRRELPGLLDV